MTLVVQMLVLAADKSPQPEDVKAGWTAFILFLLLGLAVVVLGFSLVKHLKRAEANAEAGAFDGPDESGRA